MVSWIDRSLEASNPPFQVLAQVQLKKYRKLKAIKAVSLDVGSSKKLEEAHKFTIGSLSFKSERQRPTFSADLILVLVSKILA